MPDIEFQTEMYVTASGRCPVAEFMRDLRRSDPRLAADLLRGLDLLCDPANHHRPFTAPLRDGILELRGRGNAQGRILFSLEAGRVVLLLAGIVKKTRAVPDADIRTALARRKDWQAQQ
jgi:phage-related protein